MISSDVHLLADETAYFESAVLIADALDDLAGGSAPSPETLRGAYAGGTHPPLNSILLSVPLFLFGSSPAVARAFVVVLSALTTPLVYCLARRLTGSGPALAAGLAHLLFPSFIGFSHYLWSETAYVLFGLLSLYFCVSLLDAEVTGRAVSSALCAGCFLGLMGLTRAASIPILIMVPSWISLSQTKILGKVAYPLVVLAVTFVVLLPWLATLGTFEGRIVPLATSGEYNLFLGNNPWEELGEFDSEAKDSVNRAITDYSRANSVSRATAARRLALSEIERDPRAFLWRCLQKLRIIWLPDRFIVRHIFHVVYPPLSEAVVVLILIVLLTTSVVFIGLGGAALLRAGSKLRHRGLLLVFIVSAMLPALITVADTRSGIPLLAFLLPAVGLGTTHLITRRNREFVTLLLMLGLMLLCVINIFTYPVGRQLSSRTSSYYLHLVKGIDDLLGTATTTTDRVVLRAIDPIAGDGVRVSLLGAGYFFLDTGTRELWWEISPRAPRLRLKIRAKEPTESLKIRLARPTGRVAIVEPVMERSWQRWLPSGLEGVEFRWAGGGQWPTENRNPAAGPAP